jgi:hypothetical protein
VAPLALGIPVPTKHDMPVYQIGVGRIKYFPLYYGSDFGSRWMRTGKQTTIYWRYFVSSSLVDNDAPGSSVSIRITIRLKNSQMWETRGRYDTS